MTEPGWGNFTAFDTGAGGYSHKGRQLRAQAIGQAGWDGARWKHHRSGSAHAALCGPGHGAALQRDSARSTFFTAFLTSAALAPLFFAA